MCQPSKMAEDWVIKGCHIHVNGVELAVVSDHEARVAFRSFFSATSNDRAKVAIKIATEKCLADAAIRKDWVAKLDMARVYMLEYPQGHSLASLANGRMFEFKMLKIAIQRWEQQNGKN
jgi:hypothetical protein